ncbi:MAG: 2-C-methyl-D-erythritol 2,4-cyclodiphosphate synthase [Defluviitaleaceae bacterium]|nr:2-C-methyl-D-erythritol 2,4-cyclodiphosphate synthase [Defluviitaleaceae bacterium]MCL2238785.1 2-C-methyl-D-erythritol 2,4-cyclodiphosphate synthase [Defluviitaleaceae bacterium]
MTFRIGQGYDVHPLVAGRPLILGGVEIAHPVGLAGHSDADVLCHAIMDALLGAAGLGDIGVHFPDTETAYKDISSLHILGEVAIMLAESHFTVENIDATVIAQAPKLSPHREVMAANISRALALPPGAVNVKFTTEEGLGFTGAQQGMAAQAVCLIKRNDVL